MNSTLDGISSTAEKLFLSANGLTFITRLILPVLAVIIVYRCLRSMLRTHKTVEQWGCFYFKGLDEMPINHWENVIGRSKGSDIVVDFPTVSRTHATLIRSDDGTWTLTNLAPKDTMTVNGKKLEGSTTIVNGATVTIGGIRGSFSDSVPKPTVKKENPELKSRLKPMRTVAMLTAFQLLTGIQLIVTGVNATAVCLCFLALIGITWAYYAVMRVMRRTGIEPELLAIFLSTIGFSVSAVSGESEVYKQLAAFSIGFLLFLILGVYLRDLKRVKMLQIPMLAATGILLLGNLIFGTVTNGARNWIYIGKFSFQPSEIVKIAFVYVGAATLDKLLTKKNLYYFIGYSAFCIGVLALLGDFGTAAIFFVAFLVIAYMRSGDLTALALICAAVALAALLAIKFMPYIAARFATWGHVWEDAHGAGYQQTRTMSAAASGGLLGVGAGNGWLSSIVAADTDLVFGVLCEEWGLIIALLAVSGMIGFALFTVRSASNGRSSFYVIAACAAMSIFVFQTMLNVLGSVDILPLTGVTFPFVSNGGSSLISAWGLLAFVKAADTRENASFANASPTRFKVKIEKESKKMPSSESVLRKAGGRK